MVRESDPLTGEPISTSAFDVSFKVADDVRMSFKVSVPDALNNELGTNYLALNYQSDSEEEIYGMGLQYSIWNLKGHQVPLIVTEAGVGRGLEPISRAVNLTAAGSGGTDTSSYAPTPTFIN